MPPIVAVKSNVRATGQSLLSREEARKLAESFLFDEVSSFVLPGEPEYIDATWRFPVFRAYATTEDRPLVGHLTVDPIAGTASLLKLGNQRTTSAS
jgi:hypothetical protein